MVERSSLPSQLQPQNRYFGRMRESFNLSNPNAYVSTPRSATQRDSASMPGEKDSFMDSATYLKKQKTDNNLMSPTELQPIELDVKASEHQIEEVANKENVE